MPVQFSWTLNGEPIDRFSDITVAPFGKKSSVLNIDAADEQQVGNYTCYAKNRAGQTSHSAQLIVKGTTLTWFY